MLENSQNWRRKQGQVYTTRPNDQVIVGKESKLYEQVTLKFRLRLDLKLTDGIVKDAPSIQHFRVLFNISLPCCLFCGTGSRRGRTSRSSTDASSLESPENG